MPPRRLLNARVIGQRLIISHGLEISCDLMERLLIVSGTEGQVLFIPCHHIALLRDILEKGMHINFDVYKQDKIHIISNYDISYKVKSTSISIWPSPYMKRYSAFVPYLHGISRHAYFRQVYEGIRRSLGFRTGKGRLCKCENSTISKFLLNFYSLYVF